MELGIQWGEAPWQGARGTAVPRSAVGNGIGNGSCAPMCYDPRMVPPTPIPPGTSLTNAFLAHGCKTFAEAVAYVAALPYGRTTNRADYRQVLSEGRGTCSTRHAVIAALGAQLELPVQLYIGIYDMSETNTPGVGAVLQKHGLRAMPEAHTFMRYAGERVDISRPDVQRDEVVDRYTDEVAITPEQIGDFKVEYHQRYLKTWLQETPEVQYSFEQLWAIREECIQALTKG